MLSGIHFQGSWKSVFNTSSTKQMPFFDYKQERRLGQVRMMFQRGNFAYTAIQDIGAYILELPYAAKSSNNRNSGGNSDPSSIVYEDRVSMIVVQPKKGQEIYTTIDNINKYGMERLFKELKKVKEEYEDDEVEVFLPRFETETSLNLVEALENVSIR
jgi:serine protease inhibitor